jgi:hypothetical protein
MLLVTATAIGCFRLLPNDASSHNGNNKYVRLITFKAPSESGPIGAKAKKAIVP